jgi:uncharacterized protein YfkK (UPF0435 family)
MSNEGERGQGLFGVVKARWEKFREEIEQNRQKQREARQKGKEIQEKIENVTLGELDMVPYVSEESSELVMAAFYGEPGRGVQEFSPSTEKLESTVDSIMGRLKAVNPNLYKIIDSFAADPSVLDVDGHVEYFSTMVIVAMILKPQDAKDIRSGIPAVGSNIEKGNALIKAIEFKAIQNLGDFPEITNKAVEMISDGYMWAHPDKVDPDPGKRDLMVNQITEKLEAINPHFMKIVNAYCEAFNPDQIYDLAAQLSSAMALSR